MLTSAISWLFAACTSFLSPILPTPPLLSWAVAGGCRLDLAALKYVLVTPFCGRLAVAALWPVGPLAFLVTVGILLAASLIAFPVAAGVIAVAAAAAVWWFVL